MQTLLKISEASVIALHAAALLSDGERRTVSGMAESLGVSRDHLSKVMQRLARSGLVTPVRGAGGGFLLGRKASSITVGEVMEAIEGPAVFSPCLMKNGPCARKKCVFRGLVGEVNRKVAETMKLKLTQL